MLRYEAEVSPDYVQPIPYVFILSKDRKRIFLTRRKNGGDARLEGMASIGVGGHVEDGETISDAVYRELKEEVGVKDDIIASKSLIGYIYSRETEVNKVHLGVVFRVVVEEKAEHTVRISKDERDKLDGEWVSFEDLLSGKFDDQLETWSKYLVEWFRSEDDICGYLDKWYIT